MRSDAEKWFQQERLRGAIENQSTSGAPASGSWKRVLMLIFAIFLLWFFWPVAGPVVGAIIGFLWDVLGVLWDGVVFTFQEIIFPARSEL